MACLTCDNTNDTAGYNQIDLTWLVFNQAWPSQIQITFSFKTTYLTPAFEFWPTSKKPLKFSTESIDFIVLHQY